MQAIHARQLERIRHISNIEERDDSARQWRDDLSRLRSARVITQGEYYHWGSPTSIVTLAHISASAAVADIRVPSEPTVIYKSLPN